MTSASDPATTRQAEQQNEYKVNTAAILREDFLLKKKQEKQLKIA